MSQIPADLRYAATHEWARLENDGIVTRIQAETGKQ